MTLLIMAAGIGSRYGALKQFDNLGPNNEYLFEYNIFDAIENGFTHIVVITKENFVNELQVYLKKRLPKIIKIEIIAQLISDQPVKKPKNRERIKPWGTAHAVWTARNLIHDNFVLINADDYYGNNAFKIAAQFIKNSGDENIFGNVTYSLKETLSNFGYVSRGICKVKGNLLQSIQEFTEIERKGSIIIDKKTNHKFTGMEPVSMNFWICNPTIFAEIEFQLINFFKHFTNINKEKDEIFFPLVVQDMMEEKKIQIKIFYTSAKWFGITYANDKIKVIRKLKEMSINGLYPSPLWKA
jgi:UTP-glucose-1-phosphate uridylyltransferase